MPTNNETPATQEFVEIQSIERGVVFLKSGGLRQILMVSGINIDLKSDEEQQVVLSAYQSLLNGLHFSLQIFIHSRKVNIEAYLASLRTRAATEPNELLKNQINEYIQFVGALVAKNPIMTKTFFVVVPFDPVTLPGGGTLGGGKGFFGFFGSKSNTVSPEISHTREEHMEQLRQRVSQVTMSLTEIGLRTVALQDEEIVDLFYNLYNPEATERKAKPPQQ